MVGLLASVRIHPRNRVEFIQMTEWLTEQGKGNNACIEKCLFEEVGEPNRFLWLECWTDSKSVNEYVKSNSFISFLGAMDVLGEMESIRQMSFEPEQ